MPSFVIQMNAKTPGGIIHENARALVSPVKRQVGGEGKVTLTKPASDGTFYAIFENGAHGAAFSKWLTEHVVSHETREGLPPGVTIRESLPISAMPLSSGAEALLNAFFGRR